MELKKLKVLELASVLAGPQVGSFFAELGASVTKVENPTNKGDITRKWKLPSESSATKISAYYASTNTNKEILWLDFSVKQDFDKLHEEIQGANIILVNFKPGDAEKFQLSYEDCKQLNPNLIYGEITGYGQKDKRTAFDMVLQAEAGYLSMNGTHNQMAKLPVAFIDLFAAHQLKEGILVALLQNNRPCKVSVSLYDAAIASLANQASNQLMNNHTPTRLGTLHPNIAPYGEILEFRDNKKVVLAIGSDKQFRLLMEVLNIEPNTKFENNTSRVKFRKEILEVLQESASKITRNEFVAKCDELKIPVGEIKDLKEVFDTQMAKDLIIEEIIEGEHVKKVKSAVFTISS